ncbi:MAG: DNA polymerase I [Candidatus Omnitrophica bacterium]|nr:DNA polymerase I [Candidatus Omnitrophota bacterium]
MTENPDRLFLIDGNSFCYRAFYAIRSLTNSKGQPTNAIYGFITMIRKLIEDEKPGYLAIAFDLKGPTFRHKKFEEYKIHRKPMPDELVDQMPLIKEVVRGYNIPLFEMQGYEADDVLATLAVKAADKGYEVYIVTGDKDMLQLVGPRIKVYNVHKEGLIYDKDKVKERYGVPPEGIADLIALMGDSSDNIPGVTGIGEVTAKKLMEDFGSLDKVLSAGDKIKSESLRKKLTEYRDQAILSKELATVDRDVPVKIDFDELKLKEPDNARLYDLFSELEFKRLLKDLSAPGKQLSGKYHLVEGEGALDGLVKGLAGQKKFALDFETTGTDPLSCEPVGISFCWEEGAAYYVPIGDVKGGFDKEVLFGKLKPILEDKKKLKIGQNIKYEQLLLAVNGVNMEGPVFDTMVASYLLNPSKLNHNLEDITLEYLNLKKTPITDLIGVGKKKITMKEVEIEKIKDYCCQDSDAAFRLKDVLEGQLEEKNLGKLFHEVEMPLLGCLAAMELTGVAIDVDYLAKMSKEMEKRLEKTTAEIYEIAGTEFNINSPKQLSEILFVKMKLPVVKKTKTGHSTDVEVLEALSAVHALPALLLKYREVSKLKSTYVDALPQLVNPRTGRVHTSFNQTVTATGRLSSSDPNFQNIPIKTEMGKQIRRAFVAGEKGWVILSADYSQIELRILAHFSQDKELLDAFDNGRDIHTHTASLIFGVREGEVTPEMRSIAKTVNFGIIYGMSPFGLSRELKIEVSKAKEFIDAYFEKYGRVKTFLEDLVDEARENGYVTTILNRRRYLPEINSQNNSVRQFAERAAINAPIQGSAADLIKIAMINIHNVLKEKKLDSKMILQVHDELVFEVPGDEVEETKKIVKTRMEEVVKLTVPVKVQVKAGKNWLEAA